MKNKKIYISVIVLGISIISLSIFIAFSLNKNKTENPNSQNSGFANSQIDNSEVNNVQDDKKKKELDIAIDIGMTTEYNSNLSDKKIIDNLAGDIVVAEVLSIDGSLFYNPSNESYLNNYTFGKIKILKAYKGDLKQNSKISFIREGGIVSFYEYEQALSEDQKNSMEDQSFRKWTLKEKKVKYVREYFMEDIDIIVGKTYLFYLNYSEIFDKYGSFGQKYGTREYNAKTDMVLNNETGEWEANPYTKIN